MAEHEPELAEVLHAFPDLAAAAIDPATLRRLLDRFRDGRPYGDRRATLRDDVHPALAEVIDTWPA